MLLQSEIKRLVSTVLAIPRLLQLDMFVFVSGVLLAARHLFSAQLALEWVYVFVNGHVLLQGLLAGKGLFAKVAFEGAYSLMHHPDMPPETRSRRESTLANLEVNSFDLSRI